MRFEIDRATWKNGGTFPNQPTYLRNQFGNKCCLGFACEQIDPYAATLENSFPHELDSASVNTVFGFEKNKVGHVIKSEFVSNAVKINDDDRTDNKTKEFLLTGLFAEQGHELVFVGEYVD